MRNLQEASVKSSFFQKDCYLWWFVSFFSVLLLQMLQCCRSILTLYCPIYKGVWLFWDCHSPIQKIPRAVFKKKKKKVNSGWGVVLSGECWPSMFKVLGFIPSSAKQTSTKPCSPALIVSYVSHLASECPVETFKTFRFGLLSTFPTCVFYFPLALRQL